MTSERFRQLLSLCGMNAPEGADRFIDDLSPRSDGLLLDHALLDGLLHAHAVPQEKAQLLWQALEQIEQNSALVHLSNVLAADCHRAHNRNIGCEYEDAPRPGCLSGFARDAYAFLFALACMENGRAQLRERGVPAEYDEDIPERMIRKQLGKFIRTGDITFDDFPWDIGFYACSIFFLDRFYFIPYLHSHPEAWRSKTTGRVVALWPAGERVRLDGQIDGTNGVSDPCAVETVYSQNSQSVTAHPVDPIGLIRLAPVTLQKDEWEPVLLPGDRLLALHIPGGEGYTPERVRSSCEKALAFYDRYFPELPVRGFWSESWLYDPSLARVLKPGSRILQVQRQFYCYPTPEGEEMIKHEVFGADAVDPATVECKTSLQKNLCAAWLSGAHFHTTGMFLLREDVPLVGTDVYLP